MDPILYNYTSVIENQGIISYSYDNYNTCYLTERSVCQSRHLYGFSPSSMIDSAVTLKYHNATTSLGITEQMYTAGGTQSTVLHFKNKKIGSLRQSRQKPTYLETND